MQLQDGERHSCHEAVHLHFLQRFPRQEYVHAEENRKLPGEIFQERVLPYRFLRSTHSNWLRFTTLLSEKIINEHLLGLTSTDRADYFVDDSLYREDWI